MKPPAPLRRLFLPILVLFGGPLGVDAWTLPETNPYREAIQRIEALDPADSAALEAWVNTKPDQPAGTLSETQRAFVRELSASLIAAAAGPGTTRADWETPNPTDEELDAPSLPFKSIRQLSRLVVKDADGLPSAEALAHYTAVAQFGRRQRETLGLIPQQIGAVVERIAQNGVSRRLGEFSAEELTLLSRDWDALDPKPTLAEAFAGEWEKYYGPLLDRRILPGLRELLAAEDAAIAQTEAAATTDGGEPGFSRGLRLSALVDLGGGERRISLENAETGTTISIPQGGSEAGIELVEIDFDRRVAILRSGEEEAMVNLRTRNIVAHHHDIAHLRELVVELKGLTGAKDMGQAYRDLIARVRQHPDGPEGYIADIKAECRRAIDEQIASANSPRAPAAEAKPPIASQDPIVALLGPNTRAGRLLRTRDTEAVMLQSAVQTRLAQLGHPAGAKPAPSDPWDTDGGGFTSEATPDGGFILRSRYEVTPDAPLAYKFAAPDAGFVRQK